MSRIVATFHASLRAFCRNRGPSCHGSSVGEFDLRFKVQDLRRWTFHAAVMLPTPVINHRPTLTRRPSLTKEGSLSLNQGGELLTARNAKGGHDVYENAGT